MVKWVSIGGLPDRRAKDNVASKYGLSSDSGVTVTGSINSVERYTINFPCGADLLPSPVMRTFTEVVLVPVASEEGGNIRTEVSSSLGGGDSGSSAAREEVVVSSDKREIGPSMIAIHLAIAVAGLGDKSEGGMYFTACPRWDGT